MTIVICDVYSRIVLDLYRKKSFHSDALTSGLSFFSIFFLQPSFSFVHLINYLNKDLRYHRKCLTYFPKYYHQLAAEEGEVNQLSFEKIRHSTCPIGHPYSPQYGQQHLHSNNHPMEVEFQVQDDNRQQNSLTGPQLSTEDPMCQVGCRPPRSQKRSSDHISSR